MQRKSSISLAMAAFLAIAARPAWAAGHWAEVAEQVVGQIEKAESLTKSGQADAAKEAAMAAYFDLFEDRKMETAERSQLGAAHVAEIEALFNQLHKAAGKDSGAVAAAAEPLRRALRADAKALDEAKVGPDGVTVSK